MSDLGHLSDGYHTFDELYEHRTALFLALLRHHDGHTWKAKLHSDGSEYPGWFIAGIGIKDGEQITYHVPIALWDQTRVFETRELAYTFDGHTPADVVKRLSFV